MSEFDKFLQYKALDVRYRNHRLIESLLWADGGAVEPEDRVQLCAKVTPALIDKLTEITETMRISKREFIERSIIDGIQKAEAWMEETGVTDWLEEQYRLAEEGQ